MPPFLEMIRRPSLAILLLLVSRRALADIDLKFDNLTKPEVSARFENVDCTQMPLASTIGKLPHTQTKNRIFVFYFDPSAISINQYGYYFEYTFYVGVLRRNPPEVYTCTADMFPQGGFLDQSESVRFTIKAGDAMDEGSIALPLHSIAKRDFINVESTTTPAKVDLSQATGIELTLRNVLPDQDLLIDPNVEVKASHPDYWTHLDNIRLAPSPKDSIRVHPNDSTTVRLPIQPQKLRALLATLTSVKPDSGHETVHVVVAYQSAVGGTNRIKAVDLVVRFVPSFISLVLALLLGSLVGTVAGQFLPNAWKGWYAMGQRAARGIVFSVIAELFAMLLVALGSKFVILQFDLDPWQFLPVFFIGLIVSGGKDLLAHIGLQQQRKAATPGVGAGTP